MGEPFTSRDFLDQVAWLTNQKNIQFVELLTNGSLLKQGLQKLQKKGAEFEKLSLWVSYHPSQISLDKFIDNARFAQEIYKCFVVVNGIIFPDNIEYIKNLKKATDEYNLRFNLDLGYNSAIPSTRDNVFDIIGDGTPGDKRKRAVEIAAVFANSEVLASSDPVTGIIRFVTNIGSVEL